MALELLSKGVLDAKKLITHRFPLEQINEAFEAAADKPTSATTFVAITL